MKTYDISVDDGSGQKFRIYNQPESVIRELGLGTQTIADGTPRYVERERTTLQEIFDAQHFNRGSADPPEKVVYNPPPTEYFVKVDRARGIVGDDR
jgi:hypothetical protein